MCVFFKSRRRHTRYWRDGSSDVCSSDLLGTNREPRLVLGVSLTILFTALGRLFIELNFNPYLTPLAGLSIIGTMLLGPRLMFLIVVISAINVGIMSGKDRKSVV